MSCYKHLTINERENILVLLTKGCGIRNIARQLQRSPSTISREVRRNGKIKTRYSSHKAQERYMNNRLRCIRKLRLQEDNLKNKVIALLYQYWSPAQIHHRLLQEHNPLQIGTSTIYRGIAKGSLPKEMKRCLRRGWYQWHANSGTGHLNVGHSIHERPEEANTRRTLGHIESDTVRGSRNSGNIGTHVDRKSRYLIGIKLEKRTTAEYMEKTIREFRRRKYPKVKTFTVDHGKEFAGYRRLEKALEVTVYFADPGCPQQRGTNENTNGLLRQYFPKRHSFAQVTQADVDRAVLQLNHRPRKCLNWKTPYEVFFHKVLHLT